MASSPSAPTCQTTELMRWSRVTHEELRMLDKEVIARSTHSNTSFTVDFDVENQEGFGRDGMNILTNIITSAPNLEELVISGDMTQNFRAVETFATAVNEHPSLVALYLRNCKLGRSTHSLSAIMSTTISLHYLNLSDNGIGSQGVAMISLHIARNPALQSLLLCSNCITDDDTFLIAESLKTNTNLHTLSLMGNPITKEGSDKILIGACFDEQSLNVLHDCNHTCAICTDYSDVYDDTERCMMTEFMWGFGFLESSHVRIRRKAKLILALKENMEHLEDVPMEIMPHVLQYVQEDLNPYEEDFDWGGPMVPWCGHYYLYEVLRSSVPLWSS